MYTTNPRMPRLRAKAVKMVRSDGKSVSEVARYFGYSKSAISKWCAKSPLGGVYEIPTQSSRPHHHPNELSEEMVDMIVAYKKKYNRCSDVVHQHLLNDGIEVSLNSVKRKLDDAGLIKKRSPWKRIHLSIHRPQALKPGDLVMVDTIHLMISEKKRIYVYTLIDVYSRWTYAWAVERIKILHRHSRIRKPNDNSYVERFNRTLKEECLRILPTNVRMFNRTLPIYLNYYNTERLHMGIQFKTPNSLIKCFQAIG